MNTYSPYFDHADNCIRMGRDEDGGWVDVDVLKSALQEREDARAEVERLQAMLKDAILERDETLADLSTSRRANGRVMIERDKVRAELAVWEETAQSVIELFDPLNPKASPGVLSAVAQGAKTANTSLREDCKQLRADVDKLKAENANLLRQIEWHWDRP